MTIYWHRIHMDYEIPVVGIRFQPIWFRKSDKRRTVLMNTLFWFYERAHSQFYSSIHMCSVLKWWYALPFTSKSQLRSFRRNIDDTTHHHFIALYSAKGRYSMYLQSATLQWSQTILKWCWIDTEKKWTLWCSKRMERLFDVGVNFIWNISSQFICWPCCKKKERKKKSQIGNFSEM